MQETISGDKFNAFVRALSNLTDDFDNVDIREGHYRGRRNDKHMICKADFSSITDFSLPLLMLKNKLNLLKCFKKSENVYLEINEDEDYFSFSDEYTEISFRYSIDEDLINNKCMTEEELNSSIGMREDNKIIDTEVTQNISSRIKKISSSFDAENIQLIFNGNKAKLVLKGQNQSAKFSEDIDVAESINGKANLVIKPFIMDYDGVIRINVYKAERVKDYVVIRSDLDITDKNESATIKMSFYTKAKIINT